MKKLVAVVAAALIVALSLYVLILRGQTARRDATIAEAVARVAAAEGAVAVERASSADMVRSLSEENAELFRKLQQVDRRVAPVAHVDATASVQDTVVLGPDEHRFHVVPQPEGAVGEIAIARNQKFRLDAVVIQNVDGSRLGHLSFDELDPETGTTLQTAPKLESHFQFVKEIPDTGVFHPRVVVGVESHGYPIAGIQVLNGERFGGVLAHTNLSVFGGYNIGDKTPFGGAVIGYRPFNWNLSVGPAMFFGGHGASYGAAVTLEVTR